MSAPDLAGLVGASPAFAHALHLVQAYAKSHLPVVLVGATGTGKSVCAHLLHRLSGRRGPLITAALGGIEGSLARDQLFGHEAGAFTDARSARRGLLTTAAGGTLLLDDFHYANRQVQLELLEVLESRRYRRVGGDRELPLTCRIVCATGEDLDRLVERGALVRDLQYRLGETPIHLPALDARREDIPALADRFLTDCPEDTGVPGPHALDPDTQTVLQACTWPGNVRQLKDVVQRAYVLAAWEEAATVDLAHLPGTLRLAQGYQRRGKPAGRRKTIDWALARTGGNVTAAAKLLGLHRNSILKALRHQSA